jgi:hypothetical protein
MPPEFRRSCRRARGLAQSTFISVNVTSQAGEAIMPRSIGLAPVTAVSG